MQYPIYQVDAFASRTFGGNPAAVCPLPAWPADAVLQAIAAENNLSETAFYVRTGTTYELRWFTPVTEVALCGHATLATAFVLFRHRNHQGDTVEFLTRKRGTLRVSRRDDAFEMDFPATPTSPNAAPAGLASALSTEPVSVMDAGEDLLAVLGDETAVRALQPDFAALAGLPVRGIIVTARGTECDFVSRFFAPRYGIPEDPVTGSAHCALAPYWAGILGKPSLTARQLSARGGELGCTVAGDRVRLAGQAVLYLEGTITV